MHERIRISFLDDEPAILMTMVQAVRAHGIELDGCLDADDFVRAARSSKYDAFVIDWNLRTCEGTDVCARLRRNGERRPIAIFSGKLDVVHGRELARLAGADTYIEKTVGIDILAAEIVALLRLSRDAATKTETNAGPTQHTHEMVRCALGQSGLIVTLGISHAQVVVSDLVIPLRRKEFALFEALFQRAGLVVSKEDLARIVWASRVKPNNCHRDRSVSAPP